MQLKDKVAIITGGAGGIGFAIAKALVDEGAKVLLSDIREDALKEAKEKLGENAEYYVGDITKKEVCDKTASYCNEKFSKIDFLINSAGVAQRKPLLEVNKEEFMALFEINVYSNLAMTQACEPYMEKSDSAEIISVVSSSGVFPHAGQGTYCATKYAQKALNQVLNCELYEKNIRVHLIYPSAVDTPLVRIGRPDLEGNVYCKAEEIAEIIVFLLAHRNNSVIDDVIVRRFTKRPDEM